MKVKVRTFLTMKEATRGRSSVEVEIDGGTILSLLQDLGDRFGEDFTSRIFEQGGLSQEVLVLVNGRNIFSLQDGLETSLGEGDEVAIFPPITGGVWGKRLPIPTLGRSMMAQREAAEL